MEERISRMREIYARYREELSDIPAITFMPEAEKCHSIQWLTAITVAPETGKIFMDVIN